MSEVVKNLEYYTNQAANLGATCAAGTDSLLDLAKLLYDGTANRHFPDPALASKEMYNAYAKATNDRSKAGLKIDMSKPDSLKNSYSRLYAFAKLASADKPKDGWEVIERASEIKIKASGKNKRVGQSIFVAMVDIARSLNKPENHAGKSSWNHVTDEILGAWLNPVKEETVQTFEAEYLAAVAHFEKCATLDKVFQPVELAYFLAMAQAMKEAHAVITTPQIVKQAA